jgi:hypothetical protein
MIIFGRGINFHIEFEMQDGGDESYGGIELNKFCK